VVFFSAASFLVVVFCFPFLSGKGLEVQLRSFMSMEMALKQMVVLALSESALQQLTVFEPWPLT